MTKSIVTSMHNYCPAWNHKYFNVISDYYLSNFNKYWRDEIDHLYFLDSNWELEINDPKITVIKTNPNLRYYDAYKEALPTIKEDLVGFLDNDMVVYRSGVIADAFSKIDDDYETYEKPKYDVVSIFDTIGTFQTDKMNEKNKLCPYWFFARKDLLMKYLDVDWGSNMPESETLGKLTESMLNDELWFCESEEDKGSFLIDEYGRSMFTDTPSKNLGRYHIRAGSTPAYLLTTREFGDYQTYENYMVNQPRSEYLRQFLWYYEMCDTNVKNWMLRDNIYKLFEDIHLDKFLFMQLHEDFRKYHGL